MSDHPSTQHDLSQLESFLKQQSERTTSDPEAEIRSLVRMADGGGGVTARLERFTPERQTQLAKIVVDRLSDTRPLTNAREYREWQARAAVLQALDVEGYNRLQPQILANLRDALAQIDREWPGANTLLAFRNRGEAVYRLLSVQRTAQGLSLCMDKIAEIERAVDRFPTETLTRFTQDMISETQQHMEKVRKASGAIYRDEITALRRLQPVPLVEQHDGWLFTQRGPDGTTTQWSIQGALDSADILTMRNVANRNMMIALTRRELLEVLEQNRLPALAERARANYREEHDERSVKAMESFDLPRNEPVAYLRLFPRTIDDATIDRGLLTAHLMSAALRRRYPNLRALPILFSDAPKRALIEQIRTVRQDQGGPRHFFIDIYSHGTREGLSFEEQLTAADVADVMRQFPECHFTLNTVACYGGGLNEGLQKEIKSDSSLEQRLSVFLQTRGNVVNFQNVRGEMASNYNAHLIRALLNQNVGTYGAAARRADLEVKQYMPTDAETVIRGTRIGSTGPRQTTGVS